MKIFEGKLVSEGTKVGIVCARFNEFIVSRLLSGCEDTLLRHGVQAEDITVAWVPGAFEIPLIASKMARCGRYDAVIALGAVIRGATSHYDYVCSEVAKGVASAALNSDVPVIDVYKRQVIRLAISATLVSSSFPVSSSRSFTPIVVPWVVSLE